MAKISPLRKLQEQAEAEFIRFGPPLSNERDSADAAGVEIVGTYGELEAEYAAIRKAAALIDLPSRGALRVTGADRHAFLNNMVTGEVKGIEPGRSVRAFRLNRQGRIQADLRIIELESETLIDLDYAVAQSTAESLNEFLFTEDVTIENVSEQWSRLALHGPKSLELLASVSSASAPSRSPSDPSVPSCLRASVPDLPPGRARMIALGGGGGGGAGAAPVIALRNDTAAAPGFELFIRLEHTLEAHERLVEAGLSAGLRMIGWHAYNIARIEAGTPLFLVDFGPDTLPHETGVLREAVSFTKGCYPGQEVVARMENLGHPKKTLVGLRVEGERMPVTGSQVFDVETDRAGGDGGAHAAALSRGDVIGAVTSSAPSPMLGNAIIAFAMVKWSKTTPGARVAVSAEGSMAPAVVAPLQFWPRAAAPARD